MRWPDRETTAGLRWPPRGRGGAAAPDPRSPAWRFSWPPSDLVSGAHHVLAVLLPALLVLAVPTWFIQRLALRVARATRRPYSAVLTDAVGRPLVVLEALVLYGLNVLILVTELVGMTLALSLTGLPSWLILAGVFAVVAGMTGQAVYPRIERFLLLTAVANLAFIPALAVAHRRPAAWTAAFLSPAASHPWFLLLAMAGNAVAPWMIYWQHNAVWAGDERTARQRDWDLLTGVLAMILMAAVVLLLGAVIPGRLGAWRSPLVWVLEDGGRPAGILFAVGLFDAGLLAACTVSLSSLWALREAFGRGPAQPTEAPNRGVWRWVHVATLGAAAAVVLIPHLAVGPLVLWAQAAGALWMPVTLVLLGLAARNRRLMGRHAIGPAPQAALAVVAAGFLVLALLGTLG
jgi:Mn2+/Fe2+ NRAMP family transporter